jgi:hypothetical protein
LDYYYGSTFFGGGSVDLDLTPIALSVSVTRGIPELSTSAMLTGSQVSWRTRAAAGVGLSGLNRWGNAPDRAGGTGLLHVGSKLTGRAEIKLNVRLRLLIAASVLSSTVSRAPSPRFKARLGVAAVSLHVTTVAPRKIRIAGKPVRLNAASKVIVSLIGFEYFS